MIYIHEKLTTEKTPRVYLWPSKGFYSTYIVVDENIDKLIKETFFRTFLLHNAILFCGRSDCLLVPITREGIAEITKYMVNSDPHYISLYIGDDKFVNDIEQLSISDCTMCTLSPPSECVKFLTEERLNVIDDYLNGQITAEECMSKVNKEDSK